MLPGSIFLSYIHNDKNKQPVACKCVLVLKTLASLPRNEQVGTGAFISFNSQFVLRSRLYGYQNGNAGVYKALWVYTYTGKYYHHFVFYTTLVLAERESREKGFFVADGLWYVWCGNKPGDVF